MTDTASSPARPEGEALLDSLTFRPGVTPDLDDAERLAIADALGLPAEVREELGWHGVSPLGLKMGIRFVEVSAERTVATMPVAGNQQPVGLLHGGAHLVIAETIGSVAAKLHAGRERGVVGTEIGATHHRAVKDGLVRATATAIHLGRTLATHEIVMTDDQGRRLSTVRMTNLLLDPR